MFYFYIFHCKDGTYYCGVTNNVHKREALHNSGRGARYTRIHGGGKIIYTEDYPSLKQAMQREAQVKKWTRESKTNLIYGLNP